MGTQKNRLNETVLLSTQNKCYNGRIRKYSQFFFFSIYAIDNALNCCFLDEDMMRNWCVTNVQTHQNSVRTNETKVQTHQNIRYSQTNSINADED